MASQNEQNSVESQDISLLHEKILQVRGCRVLRRSAYSDRRPGYATLRLTGNVQENNHLSLTQINNAALTQPRPRHASNTKIQRMKPPSTAPVAPSAPADMDSPEQPQPPSFVKHTTFHGFPLDLDGDTQPVPSQLYKEYTSGLVIDDDTQFDDANAPDTEQETPQINLMQHWEQPTYHEISSDEEGERDDGQYFLSSVARPTFPKTPATVGHKRNRRGDVIPSTTSTKTPGSGGMSAFGFGNAAPLTGTQLFQATQSPSSPVPDVPRSDPVLSRPSPNIRQSSPGQNLGFSSPLKNLVHSPSRSVNMAGRLSRPGTRDGVVQENAAHGAGQEEQVATEWEYHDREGFSLDDDLHHSPASDSMDEYDEFAQEIRPSQRQPSSSPRSDQSEAENDHVESSSRTSTHSSQHAVDVEMPHASAPTGRQESSHQLPATRGLNDAETIDYAVADSQPTRQETQAPPSLIEPSSMSSFVPGSYPLSQTTQRLNTLKRDAAAADSSSIPKPPPTTSQVAPQTQIRLPSSPPQLPAISEGSEQVDSMSLETQFRRNDDVTHAAASSQLSETRFAPSQRTKELREGDHRQSSNVPETDPADENQSFNQDQGPSAGQSTAAQTDATLAQQQGQNNVSNDASPSIPPTSQFNKHRASQLATQSQSQNSALTAESPRKAAGILGFADIATDPTPPDVTKDVDLNLDILSNDDHDFMDIMTSPPAKRMRLYGKKGRANVDVKNPVISPAKTLVKSPVKSAMRSIKFQEAVMEEGRNGAPEAVFNFEESTQEQAPVNGGTISITDPNPEPVHDEPQQAVRELPKELPTPVQELPDRSAEPAQVEAAANEESHNENPQLRQPIPEAAKDIRQTPPSARKREQAGAAAATRARDALFARRNREIKTPDAKSSPGKLVRPKRRTSDQGPLRTPISRRQQVLEAPKSKLSHVERVSQEHSQEESTIVKARPVQEVETPQREQPNVVTEQPQPRNDNTDVSMTDASEHNNGHDESTEERNEVTQPDRVLALFKGTGQAYYPATCLGAATLDGLKLRIRFDDGTITQLDASLVRRLELRRGDQVKVDLQGMRSKIYVVIGFQDKVQDVAPESYPKTDVHGFETIQLVAKDRDSTVAVPRVETTALLRVPVTNVYLTQTMWIRFEGRNYIPITASMTTVASKLSPRLQTPAPQHTTPATPASRSRRGTLTSIQSTTRPDLASPLPPGRGIFSGMAFAVSYSTDTAEKDRVLELIQSQGGLTLEKGFDELFSVHDLGDSPEEPESVTASTPTSNDALILSSRAQSLGFVALIADKHSRRAKYVQALALSLPCLSGRWILDSVAQSAALPWTKYLLPAGESSFLSGAVRSRTLQPYMPTTVKLSTTVQQREKLLQGGRVLLVSTGSGTKKWQARRAYAFLTVALGASVVRRVSGLDSAKRILDVEDNWGWVYVEGTVEEAEKVLFRGESVGSEGGTGMRKSKKRKRGDEGAEEKMVAVGRAGGVRIVGDEFVVQSLILGDLIA